MLSKEEILEFLKEDYEKVLKYFEKALRMTVKDDYLDENAIIITLTHDRKLKFDSPETFWQGNDVALMKIKSINFYEEAKPFYEKVKEIDETLEKFLNWTGIKPNQIIDNELDYDDVFNFDHKLYRKLVDEEIDNIVETRMKNYKNKLNNKIEALEKVCVC